MKLTYQIKVQILKNQIPLLMEIISKTVSEYISRIELMRAELIGKIHTIVKQNNGCIGTFYRNLGQHHSDDDSQEEFSNSPIVAICNKTNYCYGGFEGNTVYDIFIQTNDGKLFVTLNGEAGEDFDEPIENVQVEGLICIVSWLYENKFLVDE